LEVNACEAAQNTEKSVKMLKSVSQLDQESQNDQKSGVTKSMKSESQSVQKDTIPL